MGGGVAPEQREGAALSCVRQVSFRSCCSKLARYFELAKTVRRSEGGSGIGWIDGWMAGGDGGAAGRGKRIGKERVVVDAAYVPRRVLVGMLLVVCCWLAPR